MIVSLLSQLLSYANLTTVLLFIVVAYITWKYFQGFNLPPGPWGLPIVGYLPFMPKGNPENVLNDLCKKYGNVMSVRFGSKLVIILDDYDAIKEAYVKQGDIFSGRPQNPTMLIAENDFGITVSDGAPWREHRRFVMSSLRDYGMGKLSLEPRLMEEVHAFLDIMASQNGAPFDFSNALGMSTANIISTLEFGKRFDYNDGRFSRLRTMLDEMMESFSTIDMRVTFPWIKYLPFSDRITNLKRLIQLDNAVKLFVNDQIEEHKLEYTENSRRDLIEAYFTERQAQLEKSGDEGYFNDEEMLGTLTNLFEAGTETTTSMMRWVLLYLVIHPEIQAKVHKEIDDIIGMERDPTMSDRLKMVYTDAVLLETHRCASLAATGAPHSNLEETELFGYRIPKRSFIIANIWAVHHDPKLWKEPEKFMPERFINKEGRLEKPEYLIPFGVGKRACAGEALAKMEQFLYFTSMMQRFTFHFPKGITPTLDYESRAVRRPKAYKICAIQKPGYSV